jgi:ATP-dependent RNA helicase RhlE
MSFESLGLAPELLKAIRDCGYTEPTPIQVQAIPHLLAGRDLMGCAQTGTGKTAAFALPILHQIRNSEPGHLRALILVPTRELAIQVGRNVREYSQHMNVRSTAVYGGVPLAPQEMMLRHGVDVLVATPGRMKDHMWRGLIDFRETRFLVLDEGDRMLDMGFIDAVREIIDLIPRERQTMLFSATLEPEILRLAKDILRNPIRIEIAPPATVADGIEHILLRVEQQGKRGALQDLLQDHRMHRTLIFTRTRRGAHQLAIQLQRLGHRASSIHSDKSQSQRVAALEAFRSGRIDMLVATDIAARGLDVKEISHVVNYDMPRNAEDYVHRTGRTARAGLKGMAISLVTPQDTDSIRSIERLIGIRLDPGGVAHPPGASISAGTKGSRLDGLPQVGPRPVPARGYGSRNAGPSPNRAGSNRTELRPGDRVTPRPARRPERNRSPEEAVRRTESFRPTAERGQGRPSTRVSYETSRPTRQAADRDEGRAASTGRTEPRTAMHRPTPGGTPQSKPRPHPRRRIERRGCSER